MITEFGSEPDRDPTSDGTVTFLVQCAANDRRIRCNPSKKEIRLIRDVAVSATPSKRMYVHASKDEILLPINNPKTPSWMQKNSPIIWFHTPKQVLIAVRRVCSLPTSRTSRTID
jgi:hypothetical protein